MGIIRFLLAYGVVLAHVGKVPYHHTLGGILAVECFYVISGFLIAQVWDLKYRAAKDGVVLFLKNRAARIYLLYWTILLLMVAAAGIAFLLTGQSPATFIASPPHGLRLYGVFINLFIFGSAEAYWLGFNGGTLYPTMDFTTSPYPVWATLNLAPAWTLELELTFYLLAPLLLRLRTRYLALIVLASFGARFGWYALGHSTDPWTYRFFPFEIGVFLLGCLSYRASKALVPNPNRWILWGSYLGAVAFFLYCTFIAKPTNALPFVATFAIVVPFVFTLTKNWKLDRFLADMSFPLYLVHWPVMLFVRHYAPVPWPDYPGTLPALASVAGAVILVSFIERPLEKWRKSRLQPGVAATSGVGPSTSASQA